MVYSSFTWDIVEYLAGFGLVLLHEFGHVLACRSVGGMADRVVLWPLGGLAFVAPPPRAGANLWTTAAGPLVNVILMPILIVLALLTLPAEQEMALDFNRLLIALAVFNGGLLVFNLLPIFPLDGGRFLEALLWLFLGRVRALGIAAGIGLAAAVGLGLVALADRDWWLVVLNAFLLLGAVAGLSHARLLARMTQAERYGDRACPNCGVSPPVGAFWRCTRCLSWFDLFAPSESCPKGGGHTSAVTCFECGRELLSTDWVPPAHTAPVDLDGRSAPSIEPDIEPAHKLP